MESMTGYAFAEGRSEQFSFSVSLRSVNSKYLELNYNFPRILKNYEDELLAKAKEKLERGKLDFTIEIYDWHTEKNIIINNELLRKYVTELDRVVGEFGNRHTYSLDNILSLDGVIRSEKSEISEKSYKELVKTVDQVIKQAIQMRLKEGLSTQRDMLEIVRNISLDLDKIKKLSQRVVSDYYDKIKSRMQKISGGNIDDARLYTEVAILADKLDINEEIVRLNDHMKKFKLVVKEKGQLGRKLDFIAQEMFREINTIASKSNNSEISLLSVNIKNNIDKIREQCRNVI